MLYLELFNGKVPVEVESQRTFRSKHTDTELQILEVSLTIKNEDGHEAFLDVISDAKFVNSIDEKEQKKKWEISNKSYSYNNDGGPYQHTIELIENEELLIEELVINGVSFQPYFYKESFDEDSLVIDARVYLTSEEYERYKEIKYGELYFPVIRGGIDDREREMRFGRCVWSRDDDKIKQHIVLVDKNFDAVNKKTLDIYPEIPNIMEMLEDNIGIMDNLLRVLLQKKCFIRLRIRRDKNHREGQDSGKTSTFLSY